MLVTDYARRNGRRGSPFSLAGDTRTPEHPLHVPEPERLGRVDEHPSLDDFAPPPSTPMYFPNRSAHCWIELSFQ